MLSWFSSSCAMSAPFALHHVAARPMMPPRTPRAAKRRLGFGGLSSSSRVGVVRLKGLRLGMVGLGEEFDDAAFGAWAADGVDAGVVVDFEAAGWAECLGHDHQQDVQLFAESSGVGAGW